MVVAALASEGDHCPGVGPFATACLDETGPNVMSVLPCAWLLLLLLLNNNKLTESKRLKGG